MRGTPRTPYGVQRNVELVDDWVRGMCLVLRYAAGMLCPCMYTHGKVDIFLFSILNVGYGAFYISFHVRSTSTSYNKTPKPDPATLPT